MKKTLIALSCVALTAGALAQGTINFQNIFAAGGVSAPVTRNDTGARVGTGFWAQLYVGAVGTAEGSLTAVGVPVQFRNNATTGLGIGSVNGGTVVVPTIAGGVQAVVQMRGWDGSAGATYEAALAAGNRVGVSAPITITLGNPNGSPPTVPADLVGLAAFAIVVPEPSTIALGLLGVGALLLRRRK